MMNISHQEVEKRGKESRAVGQEERAAGSSGKGIGQTP